MGYRIGSFNVQNLNASKKNALEFIARIIRDYKLDIVALQEVLGEGKILGTSEDGRVKGEAASHEKSLLDRLPGYDMRWGRAETRANALDGGSDKRGEGYAFLWNTKRFELPQTVTASGTRIFQPVIWSQYSLKKTDGITSLARDPFYGRFKVKGLKQEIRLITTHIRYSKSTDEDLQGIGAVAFRRSELNILAGSIYPRLHDKVYGTNTPSTTILLGDYNMNLPGSKAIGSYMDEVIILDENGCVAAQSLIDQNRNIRKMKNEQRELTTLKSNEPGYANNYDHYTYELTPKEMHVIKGSHVIRVEDIPDIDFEEYRSQVSDHLPIYVDIEFRS